VSIFKFSLRKPTNNYNFKFLMPRSRVDVRKYFSVHGVVWGVYNFFIKGGQLGHQYGQLAAQTPGDFFQLCTLSNVTH